VISAKPTKNLTGISIEGEFLDFYELVDGIYRMTGSCEDYDDPYYGLKMSLLGICYEIRHAYMGDRELVDIENGVYDEIKKIHKKILPNRNVHFSTNILFPEAVFVALSVQELYPVGLQNYRKKIGESQDIQLEYSTYLKDMAMLDMLRASIADALGKVIGDDVVEKVFSGHRILEDSRYFKTQYLDKCDIEYLKCPTDKRADKLKSITRRLAKKPEAYYRMCRDLELASIKLRCDVNELEDPKLKWPEKIEW